MKDKFYKRRSISLPIKLSDKIDFYYDKYLYRSNNEFLVELIELGLLKLNESLTLQQKTLLQNEKIDRIIKLLEEEKY